MSNNVSLIAAFAAGFLSFISPCVLPLIPGYVSFVSGVSLEDMRGDAAVSSARRHVVITSLFFVLGFSLVFIALGATASVVGHFLLEKQPILAKIAGVLLIIFGLHTMGVFRIGFLENEKRMQANRKPAGALGAILVGIAFAFGWSPCIGPILGGILALAASKDTVWEGVQLLAIYRVLGARKPGIPPYVIMNDGGFGYHGAAYLGAQYHPIRTGDESYGNEGPQLPVAKTADLQPLAGLPALRDPLRRKAPN